MNYNTKGIFRSHKGDLDKKNEFLNNIKYWENLYINKKYSHRDIAKKCGLSDTFVFYKLNPNAYKKHLNTCKRTKKEELNYANSLLKKLFGAEAGCVNFFNNIKELSLYENMFESFKKSFSINIEDFLYSYRLGLLKKSKSIEEIIDIIYYDNRYLTEGVALLGKKLSMLYKKPKYIIKHNLISIKFSKKLIINFKFSKKFIYLIFNVTDLNSKLRSFLKNDILIYKIKPEDFSKKAELIPIFLKNLKNLKILKKSFVQKNVTKSFNFLSEFKRQSQKLIYVNNNKKIIYDLIQKILLFDLGGGKLFKREATNSEDLYLYYININNFPCF